ncbi:bifunctional UDP-N-acetylglucosamine diphosphorylase/glucosamine-1-phosphate N-acetyltransferase GlmU [bacterium]|nr:MAG: bifunctional UDP-N-acetylglucosamine diphosphorylase/glucosamine-1-phosphate N-acetyltransferase GlmU [bacterium]QQR61496.1 MAG: bifunctional UDP-N-acetylglucosamine diphosphorylase/glucosamine-1-phosphate N-acetyltransferase GlmU [bacterium]QQR62976.1 MAG: bifunctional UDP-N-acetylglucosamine diphosphorylase/glucosamine-1-phosphate N-acetyltransferase GlmU [bacterium]
MHHSMQAIILAAGKSQRFKRELSKLLEPLCGRPLITYQASLFANMNIETTFVVGYQKEAVEKAIIQAKVRHAQFVVQAEQKGTGHALACTEKLWKKDHILVCNGDMPLITPTIIENLYKKHIENNATVSIVTAHDAFQAEGYGRVIKKDHGVRIIETKDTHLDPQEFCCVNAGIYLFEKAFLQNVISTLPQNQISGEYYITELVNSATELQHKVITIDAPFDSIRGVNTLEQLWAVEQIKRSELIRMHMNNGVRFLMPQTTHVDANVIIGQGCTIATGVQLTGMTSIETNCTVGPFATIHESTIEHDVTIKAHSVIEQCHVKQYAKVGPFAYLRDETIIDHGATVGTFVEMKKTTLGKHAKAKHQSYLGDTVIGDYSNIGGGTITANHNSLFKNETLIDAHVNIGANCTLVAPVHIQQHAYVGAGSTITQDVPQYTLAIARTRQLNKVGYVPILKQTLEKKLQKKRESEQQFLKKQTTENSQEETVLKSEYETYKIVKEQTSV